MKPDRLVEEVLAQLAPDRRRRARDDVRALLEDDLDFQVTELAAITDQRPGHGSCDGVSFVKDRHILFRPTESRRQNFTLAHELGHVLVHDCDAAQDWLADLPEEEAGPREEWMCDQIAQRILLPDEILDQFSVPISATGVVDLFEASQASMAVCAIALSRRLMGPAGIVLINIERGEVNLACVQPDSERGWQASFPWRRQLLPEGHPLQRLRDGSELDARRRMTWTTPWGDQAPYYVNACRHYGKIVAIFADRDLWGSEQLHLDGPREYRRGFLGELTCCGKTHQVSTFPCPDCNGFYCPSCKQCQCDKRAASELLCSRCFQRKQRHLVGTDGICVNCQ
ncbi:ImmA/IrrE family metallo-endopeptidase [Propioniciclava flava]